MNRPCSSDVAMPHEVTSLAEVQLPVSRAACCNPFPTPSFWANVAIRPIGPEIIT